MVRANYKFSNDKSAIDRLVKKYPQCSDAIEAAIRDARFARENFADDPKRLSGWAHNFCCPKCASQMIMDIKMPYNPPNVFTCPNCGEKASSVDHDEAWVYFYRSIFGSYMHSLAVSALLGDMQSRDFMIRYMDFYADNYESFPVHGKHAGKGKIMEQALDEAVWIIDVLSALAAVDELIPKDKKDEWMNKLLRPITELIMPQSNSIHNIPTWLKCAVGVIGIYGGDDGLLDYALNSEFGIRNQIARGFTDDGIWYEGSMTYHFYTVSALTGFFSFYATRVPDDEIFNTYAKMFTVPIILSANGRTMPAINDGWYSKNSGMNAHLVPGRICDDKELMAFNDASIADNPAQLISAKALLFAYVEDDVEVFSSTRLAVVKKPFHILFKSGVLSTSHRHIDALSIRISPFSDDIGTPGYGHILTKQFYRFIAAHNTVAVDLAQPDGVPSTRMERIENGALAVVEPGTWADLECAERSLTVDGDSVIDLTRLKAPTSHTYDWIFHSIGRAEYSSEAEAEVESLGDKMGYSYFEDIKKMKPAPSFTASFTVEGEGTLTLTVPSTDSIEVYVAKSPDNPADNKRNTVILRRVAKEAEFKVIFTRK